MFSSAGRRGFPAAAQQEADFNSLKLGNGIRARLRHESMMAFEYWSLRGFVLELPGTKWSRGCLEIAFVESWCV